VLGGSEGREVGTRPEGGGGGEVRSGGDETERRGSKRRGVPAVGDVGRTAQKGTRSRKRYGRTSL
jgi:hypothetical protein